MGLPFKETQLLCKCHIQNPPEINIYDMLLIKKLKFPTCMLQLSTIQMTKPECDSFYSGGWHATCKTCCSAFSYSVKALSVSCFETKHLFKIKIIFG